MKLRTRDLSAKGTLKGTVEALDDDGNPLAWEDRVDLSSAKERKRLIKELVKEFGEPAERVEAAVATLLRDAREAQETFQESASDQHAVRADWKSEMTAKLPGLIDLVETDDERVAFLFVRGGELVVEHQIEKDGKLYIPPSKEFLPYLLPRLSAVERAYYQDTDQALYDALSEWHRQSSRLEEWHYRLIVLHDLYTYFWDRVLYFGYIVFQSHDPERGKSRQGKAMAFVSYRGIATETLQEANLFRWSHTLGATLFFDVKDLMTKAEKRGSDDILLGRFDRHGPRVARVYDPQAGPFKDTKYYDVYGPTIISTNDPVRDPLMSRCFVIVPPEAAGKYQDVLPENGLPLRERLVAMRARWMDIPLPDCEKPADGRLGDFMQPWGVMAKIVGGDVEANFSWIVAKAGVDRRSARADSPEALLLQAFVAAVALNPSDQTTIPVDAITAQYNEGLSDRERRTSATVGKRLTGLGIMPSGHHGANRGRAFNSAALEALCRKFGVEIPDDFKHRADTPSDDPSHPSHPSPQAQSHLGTGRDDGTRPVPEPVPVPEARSSYDAGSDGTRGTDGTLSLGVEGARDSGQGNNDIGAV